MSPGIQLRRQSGDPRAREADINCRRGLMKDLAIGVNAKHPNTQGNRETAFAPLGKHWNLIAGSDCKIHPLPQ